jgi:hypothetical protein
MMGYHSSTLEAATSYSVAVGKEPGTLFGVTSGETVKFS